MFKKIKYGKYSYSKWRGDVKSYLSDFQTYDEMLDKIKELEFFENVVKDETNIMQVGYSVIVPSIIAILNNYSIFVAKYL